MLYRLWTQKSGIDAFEWAIQAADLGAGELLVTSIDREGTGKGFDLELTRKISESVSIPIIACGGAGRLSHLSDVITKGKSQAVSLASMLHYDCIKYAPYSNHDFSEEGNIEFLRRGQAGFSGIQPASLQDIKEYLNKQAIECRT